MLEVSQPTIAKRRARIEKLGLLDYTALPNLEKLGFEIIAFTFSQWKHGDFPDERVDEAMQFLSKHPNVIFVSTGRGRSSDRIMISVHKDYRDYHKLLQELRLEWGQYMDDLNSFLVSLGADNILRPLTLRYLAQYLVQENVKEKGRQA
jgi:DNA-binding Lrp family transcriptional regulator